MSTPSPTFLPPLSDGLACRVRVVRRGDQLGTVAAVAIAAGAAVLFVDGPVRGRPSRYSVQVAVDQHVDVGDDGDPDGSTGRYVWRFLDHACDPNTVLHGRTLVARRSIAAGEAVTFDYDANEWDMAEPFRCHCRARGCRGWIRGFRHLTAAQRAQLAPIVSAHVSRLAMLAG